MGWGTDHRGDSCVVRYAVALMYVKLHTISAKIALKFMHVRGSMTCMVEVYSSLYYVTVTVYAHVCKMVYH